MRDHKTPLKKRYDLLLLAALVLVGLGLTAFVLLSRMNSTSDGLTVTIRQDNEVVATLPLDEDATYAVQDEDGDTTNLVVIEDGTVHMEEADCPDQLCVKQGKIRYAGDSLICLPNRVVVEISGEDEQALDAVAK
ncbi:MAG: NusG domain II-containing protein [Clostridiales bacterium]|nr:NusG domain II-containing protein [Clostridiales bacterium]